jgi:hypothetical protein
MLIWLMKRRRPAVARQRKGNEVFETTGCFDQRSIGKGFLFSFLFTKHCKGKSNAEEGNEEEEESRPSAAAGGEGRRALRWGETNQHRQQRRAKGPKTTLLTRRCSSPDGVLHVCRCRRLHITEKRRDVCSGTAHSLERARTACTRTAGQRLAVCRREEDCITTTAGVVLPSRADTSDARQAQSATGSW